MADQTVKVSNIPDSGSGQRVAYELMERIGNAEFNRRGNKSVEDPREYWLKLYEECRRLTY